MTDITKAIAAAREALAKRDELAHRGNRLRAEERANWECAQHLRLLLAAIDAAQPVAVAWPKADDSDKELGWSWDYKWLESLADATRAAGWDTSMEAIDFVLSRVAAPQAPPAAVPVTDAMVERALKVLAFEHDGATFPNAYSFEEVKAERATMRKVLAAALTEKAK